MSFSMQVICTQDKTCLEHFIQQVMHFVARILCITEFRHAEIKVLRMSKTLLGSSIVKESKSKNVLSLIYCLIQKLFNQHGIPLSLLTC